MGSSMIRCKVRPAANDDWLVAHIPGATPVITDAGHLANDSTVDDMLSSVGGPSSS